MVFNAHALTEEARRQLKFCGRCDLYVGYDNRGFQTSDPNCCMICGLHRDDAPTLEEYLNQRSEL